MRRVIFTTHQSPGDVVMLTAAVRDLHAAYPSQFLTDVRTASPALWEHNPLITPLRESDRGVECVPMHYPLIHQSNQRARHFIEGYLDYLEQLWRLKVPLTRFQGDIHLSDEERETRPRVQGRLLPEGYWIIVSGGKSDFTAKWWHPEYAQQVVDHFAGAIPFVQCGAAEHWHPPLEGVIQAVGQTTLRELIHLVHHAAGVLCPVTLAMHLAAAVPTAADVPLLRPCVVLAGGREPTHWVAYPAHQVLHSIGRLDCCATGGCWRSRCQPVGDGDPKDFRQICLQPVEIRPDLRIPRCQTMITAADVIRAIETYLRRD